MHIRRLVKSGAASHTISLPKSWLEKNKLSKGDILYLKEKSDKEISITAEAKEDQKSDKEITINTENKDLSTIQREITSAYINNYNSIIILGADIGEKIKDIRKILHDFVALEISEMTSSKIIARDLLNLQEISVDKTIRRMDMIIRSIIQDSIESIEGKNMYESVYHRDFDVNKLYFLMFRILKSALNDSRIAEKFNITNSEALYNWYLALKLENIADNSKSICFKLKDLDKKSDKEALKTLYTDIEQSFLSVMKGYYNRDTKLADSVACQRESIISKCDQFAEKHRNPAAFDIVSNLKELEHNIAAISRIVIDADLEKKS